MADPAKPAGTRDELIAALERCRDHYGRVLAILRDDPDALASLTKGEFADVWDEIERGMGCGERLLGLFFELYADAHPDAIGAPAAKEHV